MTAFASYSAAKTYTLEMITATKKSYKILGAQRARSLLVAENILIIDYGMDSTSEAFKGRAHYAYIRIANLGYYVVEEDADEEEYINRCKMIIYDIMHRATRSNYKK